MDIQHERKGETHGFWLGLLILAVGIAIGSLFDPRHSFTRREDARADRTASARKLHPYLVAAESGEPTVPDNGLETVALELPPASADKLQEVHDRAKLRGLILQEAADTVPAVIVHGTRRLAADVRIKGDWLDHVATDKWSLRVELKRGELFGMSVFSLQSPRTRGMLWEWLVLETARREGVLAPRSDFVNVVINGHPAGVYYLEEHFSKEMLESQRRRDGPIVLWDESTHWATRLRLHRMGDAPMGDPVTHARVPSPVLAGYGVAAAPVRAFDEKRLGEVESLSRALQASIARMHELKALLTARNGLAERMWLMQELSKVQDETIDRIVNTDLLARSHALASIFQIKHALVWHNMRFYHDQVLDRLEPIMFDNNAQNAGDRLPVVFRAAGLTAQFRNSRSYYEGQFRYLGEYCHPAWLDDLFAAVDPDLGRFEAALLAEGPLGTGNSVAEMKQRLRVEQGFLRRLLYPADPLNVEAFYEVDPSADSIVSGVLDVLVWGTTQVPVEVEGFRFGNGGFVPAARHVYADAPVPPGLESAASGDRAHYSVTGRGGVVLPYDSSSLRFRFPIDERLANLESVDELKRAVRERAAGPASLDFDVSLVYRPIAAAESEEESLRFRRYEQPWTSEGGRPAPPDLSTALERHPFLRHGSETGDLVVQQGVWDVDGDLVVPSGTSLRMEPGTTLRFQAGAVLVTDAALLFRGTPEAPVVLEPAEGSDRWSGIVVLGASQRSSWSNVVVRRTDAVRRGGWIQTGGITFYRSAVTMASCLVEGALAEDGCNVFGADLELLDVTFDGCASDSFDGDFVTGRIVGCVFRNGLADGVDLSGSEVDILECRFVDLGDKAISVGEDSRARVRGGVADRVSIGVAAKDRSQVTVTGLTIRDARHYALVAFVKKSEYGPSKLLASRMEISGSGLGDCLAQTGCTLTIDDVAVSTQDLDVDALYRDRVLGQ